MRAPVFKGNVIVSNLPLSVTPAQLADLFDSYGLVLGAKIDRWHDRPGGSQGMVDLAPETSVDKAIEALNGQLLGSNKITVKRAPKQAKRAAARPAAARPAAARPGAMPRPADSVTPVRTPAPAYTSGPSFTAVAPARKVIVEYRAPARRIVIPPRRPAAAGE